MRDADAGVEGGDVTNTGLGHVAVPFFHLDDDPAKSEENFFGFGDDGNDEVRQAIVDLEFDDFGIDEDEAEIVWAEAVEKAKEKRINADRFSGAGGAGDEGVGEVGQIIDERGAVDVLAEGDGQVGGGGVPLGTLDQVAQEDFNFGGVGDLDRHGVATGDGGEDVDALGFHRAGEIPL